MGEDCVRRRRIPGYPILILIKEIHPFFIDIDLVFFIDFFNRVKNHIFIKNIDIFIDFHIDFQYGFGA